MNYVINSQRAGTGAYARGRLAAFAVGSAAIALVLLAYYAVTWGSITRNIDAFGELFSDFIIYYYPMGEVVFHTGLPVDGFLYSPFAAILMAVFPPLGLSAALVLWGILQVVFIILYLLLFRRLVPAGLPFQLLFVGLTLSSYPLVLNFLGGSVNVFMMVGLLGMLVFNERGRRAAAAVSYVFAVSFKLYPILFIAPFAARRDGRFLLTAAAACVAAFALVPGILMGPGDTVSFYGGLVDQFRDSAWVAGNPHSQYVPHLVARLADVTGHDVRGHLSLLRWTALAVAAANLGLIYLIQRARLRRADLWSFQIVFLTIPFVLKTSWAHDFVFLSFTQALLAWRLWGSENVASGTDRAGEPPRTCTRPGGRVAVTLLFLLPSIVLSNMVFFNIFDDFMGYGSCGFLFWASLLLLVTLYVELAPPALRSLRLRRGGGP